MTGNNAKKVVFDYEGIRKKEYSRDLLGVWEDAMKAAILKDVTGENLEPFRRRLLEGQLYGQACEEVIYDLLFWVKWGHQRYIPRKDESKG